MRILMDEREKWIRENRGTVGIGQQNYLLSVIDQLRAENAKLVIRVANNILPQVRLEAAEGVCEVAQNKISRDYWERLEAALANWRKVKEVQDGQD